MKKSFAGNSVLKSRLNKKSVIKSPFILLMVKPFKNY